MAAATKAARMRQLLRDARPVVSPGVFDCYSALIVEMMGFQCAAMSGSALSNSLIGQPDIGLLSLRENVDACRHVACTLSIPFMADADTGYGNAVNVYHVVQYFEEAGVIGINVEDQLEPKHCGHMRGNELIEPREMTLKIEAALKAKIDPDFILNARTDAIAVEGIEGAIRRVREYVATGADMIYPDAVYDEDEIARLVDAAGDVPVNIEMGFGVRSRPTTPLIPLRRLNELEVARVSCPRLMSAAALMGMKKALEVMLQCIETGEVADRSDLLMSMDELTDPVGYQRISKLEQELLSMEQLERKYGADTRDYVIRQQ